MGTGVLGDNVKTNLDAYVATLTESQRRAFTDAMRKAMLETMFNAVEDWLFAYSYYSVNSSQTISVLNAIYGCTAGAAGIRITLPACSAGNKGKTVTFIKDDSTNSSSTIVPNGAQTIGGMLFVFLTEQYQKITLISDGSNWQILSGTSIIFDSGWRNTSDETNRHYGIQEITYDTPSGTLLIGETITEETSGNTWVVIKDSGTVLTCIKATGTGYSTNNKTLTGSQSGFTAEVNNGGTDKNQDTNCYHGSGKSATMFDIDLWWSSDKTEANAVTFNRMGYSDGATNTGWEIKGVDTDYFQIQTGSTGMQYYAADGSRVHISATDGYYKVVYKLKF